MDVITKSDIITAVKSKGLIRDSVIRGCELTIIGKSGLPKMFGGGFSQVFEFTNDSGAFAFKVWDRDIPKLTQRYARIVEYLKHHENPYLLDFDFNESGIFINGNEVPTMRTRWIAGWNLSEYISFNAKSPDALKRIAGEFLALTKLLHSHKISHGDLHPENLRVEQGSERLFLIDYDSFCFKEDEGEHDVIRGKDGFQHPWRMMTEFPIASVEMDYFSELVIYITLLAVSENPLLWDKYKCHSSDRFFFEFDVFLKFRDSEIHRDLMSLSIEVTYCVEVLEQYLAYIATPKPIEQLISL